MILVLLSVVAVLLLALLWVAIIVLELATWWALAPTLMVLAGFAAWFVHGRLKQARANRQLEESLRAQDDSAARPDQLADIEAMRDEFGKALQALRRSKGASISTLPWYVIIGPPGAGKSTAIRNSGLTFPYVPQGGGAIRGLGGTRHCDWWLTSEAVVLDTAGRYATQDDDREEWLSFLDTVRRYRPRRPINGVLLAVSMADLLGARDEQLAELARKLRERLDEITQRLRCVVPVYLLLTKCDLLPGFVETFTELRKAERGQAWGFTLTGSETGRVRPTVEKRVDELTAVLEKRALWRLGQERRLEARERIYELPQQLAALREPLGELVEQLFALGASQDPPFLRGAFFTSGTQEGRTLDRVMASMAAAFGIQSRVATPEPVVEAKSYFLRDVFHRVLFPDRLLVRGTSQQLKRLRWAKYGLAGAAFALALIMVFPAFVAFLRNRDLVQAAGQSKAAALPSDSPELAMERLAPLRERLEELERYASDGPPLGMRFGMYQGEALAPSMRTVFALAVRDRLLDPLFRKDLAAILAFANKYQGSAVPAADEELVEALGAVKLHLLISSPRAESEPGLTPPLQGWAAERLVTLWKRQLGGRAVTASAQAAVEKNIALYVHLVSQQPGFGLLRQDDLVAQARRALAKAPYEDLVLERILAAAQGPTWDLTLPSLLGGASPGVRCERKVRGAFTRRGWEEAIRPKLESPDEQEEGWVLGEDSRKQDRGRLQSRYYERYIAEWREFLSAVQVEEPRSNADALSLLQSLTRGEPTTLSRLWRGVGANVLLAENRAIQAAGQALKHAVVEKVKGALGAAPTAVGAALSDRGGDLLGPEDVQRTFAGFTGFGVAPAGADAKSGAVLGLDLYVEQLQLIRDALQAELDNPGDRSALQGRLQAARAKVRTLLDGQEVSWRPRLNALLWPQVDGIARASSSEAASETSARWCSSVVGPFERALSHGYPFVLEGQDAPVADLVEFFRPDTGTLWAFVGSALKNDVERVGDRYEFAKKMGSVAANVYRPQLLEFLNRAHDVTSALFPPSSAELMVPFAVHVLPSPNVALVTFEVDGQVIEYRNGPEEWHSLRFPNPGHSGRSAIRVRTARGLEQEVQKQGEWSFFRLLEAGTIRPASGRLFVASWHFSTAGVDVEMEIRPSRTEAPFFEWRGPQAQLFRLFRDKSGRGLAIIRDIGRTGASCAPEGGSR